MFFLTRSPIESHEMADLSAGAWVVFEGRVRKENEGREVARLEYEAFDELALKEGLAILEDAMRRFPILKATCVHRLGLLGIGDVAIRVDVLAAHREEAFSACKWIVDEVKGRVPIWKKEHYVEGGAGWIGADEQSSTPQELTPPRSRGGSTL
jgi:molybdopterin synthase catalytic subunit